MGRKKSEIKTEEILLPDYKISIKCLNNKQKEFVNSLKKKEHEICFGTGSAGTGKSYLSFSVALSLLKTNENFKKIIIFVPTCESTKELSMGFLKGTLEEKSEVYKQNSYNTLIKILETSGNNKSKEIINEMISKKIIEFEFINFVKGKTFSNCICVLEEAEDLSKEDMLLLLTRKGGENCKMFISGDDKQISRSDLRNRKERSGLKFAANVLKTMNEVSVTEFDVNDIVRDKLLTEIIKRFEEN